VQIASFLGDRAGGSIMTPRALYPDAFPEEERGKYDLLMVGGPYGMPLFEAIKTSLPVRDLTDPAGLPVRFIVSRRAPTGYVEFLPSPWNPERVVLMALESNAGGVDLAASALSNSPLRARLHGNFAVITGAQVLSAEISPASPSYPGPSPSAGGYGSEGEGEEPEIPGSNIAVFAGFATLLIALIGAGWLLIAKRKQR
jgi:hypothetical protein